MGVLMYICIYYSTLLPSHTIVQNYVTTLTLATPLQNYDIMVLQLRSYITTEIHNYNISNFMCGQGGTGPPPTGVPSCQK